MFNVILTELLTNRLSVYITAETSLLENFIFNFLSLDKLHIEMIRFQISPR